MRRIIRKGTAVCLALQIILAALVFSQLYFTAVTFAGEQNPAALKGHNFVLFGLSGNNSGDDNRSDTIMIVTIDPEGRQIKLTSILRDTKAAIEGHEPQKINAAYKYGGAELALDTLNRNFGLALKDYITVDFATLEQIVDILDGIELELTAEEAAIINEYADEEVSEGWNLLNGEQALLYSRIRKIDSDSIRVQRQQRVIQEILAKLKDSGFLKWLRCALKIIETCEISIPLREILQVIRLPFSEYTLVNNVIPDPAFESEVETMIDEHGEWVWVYDLKKAGERIVDIINN
ncbi:MAG: LCP family protein [Parasporobacterium sp.]|nr:LCP family protein [Parasporobacterium sp.]